MEIDFSPAVEQLQKMINEVITLLPNFAVAILVFIVLFIASKGIGSLVRRLSKRYNRHQNLGYVLGRLAQWFVALLGLLIAMVIAFPNFSPAQMIQLLGISGIAIGFAFRDILENFLAGILLLLSDAFRIGDQIAVENIEGTVEDIQTRATTIHTYDGRRVVMPNAKLFTNIVIVNTAYDNRRIECDVGIGYRDDIDKAKRIILETIYEIEDILDFPEPDVIVSKLGDYSVLLKARWWIRPPRRQDALQVTDKVLIAIKNKLVTGGVSLPYPTTEILLHSQKDVMQ